MNTLVRAALVLVLSNLTPLMAQDRESKPMNVVFVLVDDVLKEREIITGISNWGWTEVVSGVDPGDLVVISIDQSGIEDGALASVDTDTE